jgi:hypothetical protein
MKLLRIRLTQTICYGKSEGEVELALNQKIELAPDPQNYLDTSVHPVIPLFSDCCKGDALTFGYRATSVAKSANTMIRRHLPSTAIRLADLRLVVSRAYSYRRQTGLGRILISNEMRQIITPTGLNLEANLIAILAKSIKKSKRLVVEDIEDECVVVMDGQKRYLVDATGCPCGSPVCWAYHVRTSLSRIINFSGYFPPLV